MLSTTRISAVWLLMTESLGLESTRTVPKDSSNWRTPAMFVPLVTASVRRFGNVGVLGRLPGAVPITPVGNWGVTVTFPEEIWLPEIVVSPRVRRADQSIPCWYWLFSWTSAIVASINTWRFALASTWSRNSWIFSCCREVARTMTRPTSALTITAAASRKLMLGAVASAAAAVPGAPGGAARGWDEGP